MLHLVSYLHVVTWHASLKHSGKDELHWLWIIIYGLYRNLFLSSFFFFLLLKLKKIIGRSKKRGAKDTTEVGTHTPFKCTLSSFVFLDAMS